MRARGRARRCPLGSLLKSIAVGLGCALCFGALADPRAASDPLLAQERGEAGVFDSRPLGEEQLARLRGRLASPPGLEQTAVILWDEPRPGVPPPRSANPPSGESSVSAAGSIHRK